jgi:cytochrome c
MMTTCSAIRPLLLAALATCIGDAASAEIGDARNLLEEHCAMCHSIGASGTSPLRAAPPLRQIGQRYDLDELAERLREGTLVAGHPEMPSFRFSGSQARAIRNYLRAIQE